MIGEGGAGTQSSPTRQVIGDDAGQRRQAIRPDRDRVASSRSSAMTWSSFVCGRPAQVHARSGEVVLVHNVSNVVQHAERHLRVD